MNLEISYDNLCACVEQQLLRQLGHVKGNEDVKIHFETLKPSEPIKLTLEIYKQEVTATKHNAEESTQLS